MMDTTQRQKQGNRAVSPVIGVILMVAITVILAAVIGAFVLEIGDQQETAPSTSFDSDQQTKFYCDGATPSRKANLTTVDISHAGGNTLDISQISVKVEGNASSWQMKDRRDCGGGHDRVKPVPDFTQTLGTNDVVEFSSGQTWSPFIRNGPNVENVKAQGRYEAQYQASPDGVRGIQYFGPSGNNYMGSAKKIETGHNVRVVWTASSGGKTQTLFKYTVQ